MQLKAFSWLLIAALVLPGLPASAQAVKEAQAPPPLVEKVSAQAEKSKAQEPDPLQVLKKMCDYLKDLQQFSCQADITEDVLLTTGQKIQLGKTVEASVRRPNRIRAKTQGDADNRQMVYDGKTITLLDLSRNVYATIDAPPDIDAALNHAILTFNLRAPMSDLIYTESYKNLTSGIISGFYSGLHQVQGVPCHHLAFRQKDIDWQIWIEVGPTPLPRKFLITDKKAKGLQFTAVFSKWNTSPKLEDGLFTFVAPEKAEKIDLRPKTTPADAKKTTK